MLAWRIIVVIMLLFMTTMISAQPNPQQTVKKAKSGDSAKTQTTAEDAYAQPLYSDGYIVHWSKKVAALPFNFTYKNYKKHISLVSSYFTKEAWKTFLPAIQRYGDYQSVIKQKTSVRAFVRGNVRILKKGVLNGHYSWKVAMPLRIAFRSRHLARRKSVIATLIISRADPKRTHDGLVITYYHSLIRSVVDNASHAIIAG